MKKLKRLAASVAVFTAACGGSQAAHKQTLPGPGNTTSGHMTSQAEHAAPPPQADPTKKVERKVTDDAKDDFAAAVTFFQQQDAAGPWTADKCNAAAGKFKDVASSHDKLVEAWYDAGVAYQKCNDLGNAEAMYKKAIEINPAHAPSLANLGEIYYRGGNVTLAKQYYDSAVKADTKLEVSSARNNLAWMDYQIMRDPTAAQGDKDAAEKDAISNLQRALAVDNDNVVAYTLMALVYMEGADKNKNRLDVAQLLLSEATDTDASPAREKNKHYAPLWNAWGLLDLQKNDIPAAVDHFHQALGEDANFVEARENLAQIELSFRKYKDAQTDFEGVLKNDPKNYDAMIGLGVALRGNGDIDGAEKQYQAALKLDSSRPEAYFNLGVLYKEFRTPIKDEMKIEDYQANEDSYKKAKDYFTQFQQHAGKGNADKVAEAKKQMDEIGSEISAIDETIDALKNPPPPDPADQGDQGQPPADGSQPPADGSQPPANGGTPPANGGTPPASGGAPANGGTPPANGGGQPPAGNNK